jgi:hypothetical protein
MKSGVEFSTIYGSLSSFLFLLFLSFLSPLSFFFLSFFLSAGFGGESAFEGEPIGLASTRLGLVDKLVLFFSLFRSSSYTCGSKNSSWYRRSA